MVELIVLSGFANLFQLFILPYPIAICVIQRLPWRLGYLSSVMMRSEHHIRLPVLADPDVNTERHTLLET